MSLPHDIGMNQGLSNGAGGYMERLIHFVTATAGAVIGFMYGEITGLFIALVALMVIDYITGVIKAYIKKELSSQYGFKGILKKVCILLVIAVAHMIDMYIFANDRAIVMNMALLFYSGNEGLSILENLDEIGVPIPPQIRGALKQTVKKASKEDDENGSDTEAGQDNKDE